jgi:hypothetical protein
VGLPLFHLFLFIIAILRQTRHDYSLDAVHQKEKTCVISFFLSQGEKGRKIVENYNGFMTQRTFMWPSNVTYFEFKKQIHQRLQNVSETLGRNIENSVMEIRVENASSINLTDMNSNDKRGENSTLLNTIK